ncbi:PleD family two-component system response regulator [Arenimonas sp.]|uniref:response regulator n=1 Tax=Arenimonas sp. TaxID=1872635 RepID=UPI0035B00D9E
MDVYDRIKRLFGWGKAPAPEPRSDTAAGPQAAEEKPAPSGPERRGKARTNARPGTRMLVIDDSATIVALLSRMLRQNDYTVLEASDAEQGLEIARTESPELVFLDIVLPGMDGFAALRQLRRDPATRDIPVIMISGNEQATEQFYVHRIGADDFMKKPFSRAEVFARIERLLDANRVPKRLPAATRAAAGTGDDPETT